MTLLSAKNIHKTITTIEPHLTILAGINFDLQKGESAAILGVSGSGKSTLLGILAGLSLPTTGEVIFNGQPLAQLDEDKRAQLRLGKVSFVFQNFELLPHYTAFENVKLPLDLMGQRGGDQKVTQMLEKLGLKERLHHHPSQLSGGEQQRVALARAFVTEPSIIFADEPTGALDTKTGSDIISALFDLNENHQTALVMVTHDQQVANKCTHRYLLKEGQLNRE